ncbi:MAG: DUF2147 domain-containing protein [Pseudomonadaceae bacterium]|nr:DUF2147 domain-containing protein [Pseudomonadaceae bacterium]
MNRLAWIATAVLALLSTHAASASGIEGLWDNEANPVSMVILVSDDGVATGKVAQNEQNPESVGRLILKSVVADPGDNKLWRGQVFAARLGEFRDAEVRLVDDERLEISVKVGFLSRTVGWTRQATQASEHD